MNMTNNDSNEKKLIEFYKELSEREKYRHSVIWMAMRFFTLLISGLITIAFSVASLSLYATIGVLFLAIILTFLGHYVLVEEGRHFHEDRYEFLQIRRELGYYELDCMIEVPASKASRMNRDKYLNKFVNRYSGVRYAFRLLYMIEALFAWFSLLVILILMDLDLLIKFLTGGTLLIVALIWYRWEIKTLYEKLKNWIRNCEV